jgi:hypothetical protein
MAIPVIHFGGPPDEQGPWHPASRGGAAPAQPARGGAAPAQPARGGAAPAQPARVGAVTPAQPDRKTFYPRSRSEHNGTHYKLTIQALRQESSASLSLDAGAAAESKSPAADNTSQSSSVPGQSLPPAETTGLSRVAGRANLAAKPSPKRNQPEKKATPTSSWMQVHACWKQSALRRCTRSTVAPFSVFHFPAGFVTNCEGLRGQAMDVLLAAKEDARATRHSSSPRLFPSFDCPRTADWTPPKFSRRGETPVFRPNSETGGHALHFYPLKAPLLARSSSHSGTIELVKAGDERSAKAASDGRYVHIETGVAASWASERERAHSLSPPPEPVSRVHPMGEDAVRAGALPGAQKAWSTKGNKGDSFFASLQRQRPHSTPPGAPSWSAVSSLAPPLSGKPSSFLAARSQTRAAIRDRHSNARVVTESNFSDKDNKDSETRLGAGQTVLHILTEGRVRRT